MRLMVVYDLANQSTHEVGEGVRLGLVSLGHEVTTVHTNTYANVFFQHIKGDVKLEDIPADYRAAAFGQVQKWILADAVISRPEVVIVISGWCVSPALVGWLRDAGITTVLYLTESPYQDQEQSQKVGDYDVVLCNELASVAYMRRFHPCVTYMPHSFNPEVHHPVEPDPDRAHDVFMCATGFRERLELLAAADWRGIDLKVKGGPWPGLEGTGLEAYVENGLVKNAELPAYYASAAINLNIHRTSRTWRHDGAGQEHIGHEDARSLGPRVYEVLACGGFLLTDYRVEADMLMLRDGEHLAYYRDAAEMQERIRFYLQRPEERRRISAAGREAVKHCTFADRLKGILFPALAQREGHAHNV